MEVALKIWRYDSRTGERALKQYEVEAPEWACLLDVLDLVKDKVDGTLAYRKSCRMMICGSCGMRMDGAAILACKERMKPIVDAGHDPRDAIAKLGAESIKEGIDRDLGAKHAKWFVTSAKTTGWLRETELVPKTQGVVSSIKEIKFAMGLARHGKVPPPFPPHVAEDVREARALYNLVKEQGRDGAAGIVQGEHGLSRIEFAEESKEKGE